MEETLKTSKVGGTLAEMLKMSAIGGISGGSLYRA